MSGRMAYKGQRIRNHLTGRDSSFFALPSGAVYEDHDGSIRRVGVLTGDGGIKVKPKYRNKFGTRLKQISKGKV